MSTKSLLFVRNDIRLHRGDGGDEVASLQEFLSSLGYLALPDVEQNKFTVNANLLDLSTAPQAKHGNFDDATAEALLEYQKFHGLPLTAVLDKATLKSIRQRRCGYPDVRILRHEIGNPWNKTALTYGFRNYTSDMVQDRIRSSFSIASNLWVAALSGVTNLTFSRVDPATANTDIPIRFGTHDGAGGEVAVATIPGATPYNQTPVLFDDAETWTDVLPTMSHTTDLVTFMAHELGHCLGLDHINVQGALMNERTIDGQRTLAQVDINAIRAVYAPQDGGFIAKIMGQFKTDKSEDAAESNTVIKEGDVIQEPEGFRFAPEYNSSERKRLTRIPPQAAQTPESREIDLAPYAGQKIRVRGLHNHSDWVYSAQVVAE
ncbi:MAG TPA: matrixin family metalloprotease [Pyrinomonadaceae bacterium]